MSKSLQHLRELGYEVAIVEHYNKFARKRFDLFGFADILAVKTGETIAVQTTTTSNMSARIKKMNDNAVIPVCLAAGWRITVHGWALRGKAGKRKLWTLKEFEFGS